MPSPSITFTVYHDSPQPPPQILGVCAAPLHEIAAGWNKARRLLSRCRLLPASRVMLFCSSGARQLNTFYWLSKSLTEFEEQQKQQQQPNQPGRLGRLYINYRLLSHGEYVIIKALLLLRSHTQQRAM
jgi:hypothetical protein